MLSGCFQTLHVITVVMLSKSTVFAFFSGGKSFEKWEVEDICAWLTQNMLEEHCGCFRENKVGGSTLLSSLKDGTLKTDLKDIRVKALGKSSHFIISSASILMKFSL